MEAIKTNINKSYPPGSNANVIFTLALTEANKGVLKWIVFFDGFSMENAWACGRQIAARLQSLGIQDTLKKTKPPSKNPGVWSGSIFLNSQEGVFKMVTKEKWEKVRHLVSELASNLLIIQQKGKGDLEHKHLERIWVFYVI